MKKYLTPLDFFKVFFTVDLVKHLCKYTNDYAKIHGSQKPSLYKGWKEVTPDDMYIFFGLLMYMGVVQVPNAESYWSTAILCHGLWARHFMSKLRFKAIQSFLKVCNAETENNVADKLCKARFLHDYIRRKCMKLYQPYENVAVDERMVKARTLRFPCTSQQYQLHHRHPHIPLCPPGVTTAATVNCVTARTKRNRRLMSSVTPVGNITASEREGTAC